MNGNNQDYWAKQARRYDRATLLLNRNFDVMSEAAAAAIDGVGDVLEVAAGTGVVSEKAHVAASRYVATDRSPEMLEILRGRLGAPANLEVRTADALALDFPDESFDAVLACNLLHLLPTPWAALAEARRVLRPDGVLVAPTFCHGAGWVARGVSWMLATTGFPVVTRFEGEDLDALVGETGFVCQQTCWFNGLLPIRFLSAVRRSDVSDSDSRPSTEPEEMK